MEIVIEDPRLCPILDKVRAGERLSYEDGITLYRTSDILALGYMANLVRERLHGDVTYFNVNRHINPTDVCVASCLFCAFARLKRALPSAIRRCRAAGAQPPATPTRLPRPSPVAWRT